MADTLASGIAAPGTAVGDNALVTDNDQQDAPTDDTPRVVVIDTPADDEPEDITSLVDQPAKVMRIGTMVKQLLDEVRSAPLDDAARVRLAEIHERSLHELEEGLSPELVAELHRITLPFVDDRAPSDAELRIAQAQLVGGLEGLFHGIQTALVAQQSAAQGPGARRQLPAGPGQPVQGPQGALGEDGRPQASTGQYL
jgi:hypothetical protein